MGLGTFAEFRDKKGYPPGGLGRVGDPLGGPGGSGDPPGSPRWVGGLPGGPGRVEGPSLRSQIGLDTLYKVWDVSGTLP